MIEGDNEVMYYIVEMNFPNGNKVTLTVVARSEGDAASKSRLAYPEAMDVRIIGQHGA